MRRSPTNNLCGHVGRPHGLSGPGARRQFGLQRRAEHRAHATWHRMCDGIRPETTRRSTPPRITPRSRRPRCPPAYIFRSDPPQISSSIVLRCGTRLSLFPIPSHGATKSDHIYARTTVVYVCFRAKSIARCSHPASSPSRQADARSSLTPTIDRISSSATWYSSIRLGSAGGSVKKL